MLNGFILNDSLLSSSILKFQCHLVACSEDMEWKKSMGFQEQFFPKTSVSKFANVEVVVEVPAFSNPLVKSHVSCAFSHITI